MLRAIVAVLLILWLLGFSLHIAGGVIHLLIVVALIVFIFDLLARVAGQDGLKSIAQVNGGDIEPQRPSSPCIASLDARQVSATCWQRRHLQALREQGRPLRKRDRRPSA
jgi:hypothetical protein